MVADLGSRVEHTFSKENVESLKDREIRELREQLAQYHEALEARSPKGDEVAEYQYFCGGKWNSFIDQDHFKNTKAAGYPIRALYAAPQIPEGWEILPEDLRTHLGDFREAMDLAISVTGDPEGYWAHQLETLDRVEARIQEGVK